jgi:uncharacterized damage-inducible protein DinB
MSTIHPLVQQLRFTRSEFKRGLTGLSEEEAAQRFLPMNCISWNVGHLAWQEQRYVLNFGMGLLPYPDVDKLFAYGAPASTPSLGEMLSVWQAITAAGDAWLDTLTSESLQAPMRFRDGQSWQPILGSLLQRMIYHYWYHTGENLAIRQMLGHTNLPQFVGDLDNQAPYTPG